MNTLNIPKKIYFKNGCTSVALRELTEIYHLKRALLVSDPYLYHSGTVAFIGNLLRKQGMRTAEYFTISAVPTFGEIESALPKMLEFEPDVIIGIGGGAAISAAKAMWIIYEKPQLKLLQAIKKPELIMTNVKAKAVWVATSFGSGAQNSPFAVLADEKGKKQILNSIELLPEISVTDAMFTATLSADQVKREGLETLSLAINAFCDPQCNEYTQGMLREAIEAILKMLKFGETGCPVAREKLHNAAALAGAAYGNVFSTLPSGKEKPDSKRLTVLAKELGFTSAEQLQSACEKLK